MSATRIKNVILPMLLEQSRNNTYLDIGANVGLYSIYAAKLTEANVYAFEPSVLNLEILYKNIDFSLFFLVLADFLCKWMFYIWELSRDGGGRVRGMFRSGFGYGNDLKKSVLSPKT